MRDWVDNIFFMTQSGFVFQETHMGRISGKLHQNIHFGVGRLRHSLKYFAQSEDAEHNILANFYVWPAVDKKNACPYCVREFTHFPRHLERCHKNEPAVQKVLSMSFKNPERRRLLDVMRREGNFISNSRSDIVRPVRRPKGQYQEILPNAENLKDRYVACQDCLGYYARNYLRRHRRKCPSRKESTSSKEQHLSSAQLYSICSGSRKDFYATLRLKKEVFPIMRNDNISTTAMKDTLICNYAESLLRKHKRPQIKNVISNKMRELGRLLLTLRRITGVQCLFDALMPEMFENIVSATKIISGYDPETRSFKSSSLALHMGTTLKQICDIANKLLIEKSSLLPVKDHELSLTNVKRLRKLVECHWNTELASLALKNLNERKHGKPGFLPLTSDVLKFQNYALNKAKEAELKLKDGQGDMRMYRTLLECVFGLALLLNRKRIGLTKSEKTLTKNFKRVVTLGKGSKPVPILFSAQLQELINVILSLRHDIYQTAKVSKLLLAINSGKGHLYKGKSLDEIDLSDNVGMDSDSDSNDYRQKGRNGEDKGTLMKMSLDDGDLDFIPISEKVSTNIVAPGKVKDTADERKGRKVKNKPNRVPWTEEEKHVIRTSFKNHIKRKKAPKKHEVEEVKRQNPVLFQNRSWVVIKAFVYNCYRNQ
nr:unnamed protein product [Callosobruchus analis]